ncbi:MAG: hypothetical protein CL941_04240 [Desulfobacter sp.]|nr:hypothetical protein [Desulfobacter sp.]
MLSSLNGGISPCVRPTFWCANPDEETTDWRAVCGKPACTVRRSGRAMALPDPYLAQMLAFTYQISMHIDNHILHFLIFGTTVGK